MPSNSLEEEHEATQHPQLPPELITRRVDGGTLACIQCLNAFCLFVASWGMTISFGKLTPVMDLQGRELLFVHC